MMALEISHRDFAQKVVHNNAKETSRKLEMLTKKRVGGIPAEPGHEVFLCQLRPEGRNARGETWLTGPEVVWGPEEASEFDPSFQQFGVSETPSQGPLRAPERLSEARRGSSGASERCVRFRRSGKTRWASQRPLRGPIFPDAP